jgi:hypothetical protein
VVHEDGLTHIIIIKGSVSLSSSHTWIFPLQRHSARWAGAAKRLPPDTWAQRKKATRRGRLKLRLLVNHLVRSRRAIERGDGETIAVAAAGINIASCTVGLLHAIDVGLGVALVVYGGLVHVTAVMAVTISYGLVLLLGALAGAIGYFSGACSRRCLRASATAAFLTSILDIGAFIAILVSWDSFVGFLDENYEHLMLSEDSVKVIQGLKIPLAVIFAVLAGLEVLR